MLDKRKGKGRDIVQEFVDILQAEISRGGLSISELARRAGVARPYLHRVLAREHVPTIEWCEKVLNTLGVTIDFKKSSV